MSDFTIFGLTEEDMFERLEQAIIDSMDVDWRCMDGARAVLDEIKCWVADDPTASCDTHPKGGDVEQAPSLMSGAVAATSGETPKGGQTNA